MTITPLADHVVLQVNDGPTHTAGGIVIPEKARAAQMRDARAAIVIAAGPGRTTEQGTFLPVDVKPGDVVLLPTHAGIQVELAGKTLRMIRSCELLGKLEESRIVSL